MAAPSTSAPGAQPHPRTERLRSSEHSKNAIERRATAGPSDSALIFGNGDEGSVEPTIELQADLEQDGTAVTVQSSLPADLASFRAIWYIGTEPLTGSQQLALEGFVKNGGGLYLTGERSPCCEALDKSDEAVIASLVRTPHVTAGDGSDVDDPTADESVNPDVLDSVSRMPKAVSSWLPSAPGVLLDVAQANTLTTTFQNGVPVATGAVWDSAEIGGGAGRLAVLMDINWLEPSWGEPVEAAAMVLDLEHFLQAGTVGEQPRGAPYVALGDSFSSGEGNPPFEAKSNTASNKCHRSLGHAYPLTLASSLGLSGPFIAFVACSGATTGNIWSGPDPPEDYSKDPEPHQLNSLSRATRVVTLTAGGDDIGFPTVLTECVIWACPVAALFSSPVKNADRDIANLRPTLEKTYREVRRVAPNAKVYVLGYPYVFPLDPSLLADTATCIKAGLVLGSLSWLAPREVALDDVIKNAATSAGVTYIDPNAPGKPYSFLGHDVCSSSSWFNNLINSDPTEYSFHPNHTGQAELAAALSSAVSYSPTTRRSAGAPSKSATARMPPTKAPDFPTHPDQHAKSGAPGARPASEEAGEGSSGGLAGVVREASSGNPLSGVDVSIFNAEGAFVTATMTLSEGEYAVNGLPAGDYTVEYSAESQDFVRQFYDDAAEASGARTVVVTEGATTAEVDAALQPGGAVSGTVENASDEPVEDVEVTAQSTDPGGPTAFTVTGSDGGYSLAGLEPGGYTVEFSAEGQNLLTQFYDGASEANGARTLVVTAGTTTGEVNAQLQQGGQISGTVTNGFDEPVGGVAVTVQSTEANGPTRTITTGSDGVYSVVGLPSGSYTIEFNAEGKGYVRQFYDSAQEYGDARPVVVTAGSTSKEVDAELQPSGGISGTVTNGSSEPVANVMVYAQGASGGAHGVTTTTADGTYTLDELPPGEYTLEFVATGQNYLTQFYNGQSEARDAQSIEVVAGIITYDANAILEDGGAIAGTVTNEGKEVVPGVEVVVQSVRPEGPAATTTTSAVGTYSIAGLPEGAYTVEMRADDEGYLPEFYGDAASVDEAVPVSVNAGKEEAGVNASLRRGATISGTITSESGDPLSGVEVYANSTSCTFRGGSSTTSAEGTYTIDGLASGSYDIAIDPSGQDYGSEEYLHDPVAVVAPNAADGVDATLASSETEDAAEPECLERAPSTEEGSPGHQEGGQPSGGEPLTGPAGAGGSAPSISLVSGLGGVESFVSRRGDGKATLAGSITTRSGRVLVPLRCPATSGRCQPVAIQLTVAEQIKNGHVTAVTATRARGSQHRVVVVATSTVALSAGVRETVKVSLNMDGRRLAARANKLPVKVSVQSGGAIIRTLQMEISTAHYRVSDRRRQGT
jgi:GDSL-like Lipase/Acylhydrolase family/Carboxypeptidase regulatory-like domain